MKIESNT